MKAKQGLKMMNERGFSLMELMFVIAIIAVLSAIAGVSYNQWMDRYKAESQVKTMYTDLMQARLAAMQRNKIYFVKVNADSYQVVEDTKEDGVPGNGDTYGELKPLNYPPQSWTGTITINMDTRGLMSIGSNTLTTPFSFNFNTGSASPEYDCFQLYATRIAIGKWDGGTSCVAR